MVFGFLRFSLIEQCVVVKSANVYTILVLFAGRALLSPISVGIVYSKSAETIVGSYTEDPHTCSFYSLHYCLVFCFQLLFLSFLVFRTFTSLTGSVSQDLLSLFEFSIIMQVFPQLCFLHHVLHVAISDGRLSLPSLYLLM